MAAGSCIFAFNVNRPVSCSSIALIPKNVLPCGLGFQAQLACRLAQMEQVKDFLVNLLFQTT
jgi:hypothetical protein